MSGRKVVLIVILAISFLFFVMGLSYPILMSTTSLLGFNVFSQSIHLTDTLTYFCDSGDWFMVGVIGITTIVFPVYKYADMLNRIIGVVPLCEFYEKVIAQLDKWSMLEVFVIALVVLSVKDDSGFMTVTVKSGLYFLTVSVIIRMLISSYMALSKETGL